MPTYDTLDYQIIQVLQQDARTHASQIARIVGANERTVRKRIDRLASMGALRLTAVLDPSAFGYRTVLDVFFRVEPEHEQEVVAQLLELPEIAYLATGQGTHDISIQARFKDNEAMRDFLRHRLPAIPGLEITGSSLVPDILRSVDAWLPPQEDFGIGPA